jgi:hypothetical protein
VGSGTFRAVFADIRVTRHLSAPSVTAMERLWRSEVQDGAPYRGQDPEALAAQQFRDDELGSGSRSRYGWLGRVLRAVTGRSRQRDNSE